MKKSIAIGFALSILAAGSAFASPAKDHLRSVELASISTKRGDQAASKNAAKPFAPQASGSVIVAENRKEFGSHYQRY